MKRIAGAVFVAYIAMGVLTALTTTTVPSAYYALSAATAVVYSIAGGYLCAAVAGAFTGKAKLTLILLGESAGIVVIVWLWPWAPHRFTAVILGIYPLCLWIGSKLRSGFGKTEQHGVAKRSA